MDIPRYYTVGAIVPDARSLRDLGDRLDALDSKPDSAIVMTRRRDESLARNIMPEARVRKVETGLSRRQWLEFSSTFFSASTVSFLMGVVHLWTGLIVQALLTIASIIGLIVYHRRPRLEKQLLRLGLPDGLADEWAGAFPSGFALVLATVPEDLAEEAQGTFLEDRRLQALLATDRRPVL
ncbi:hypothetical protein BH24ACT19_BH24ACT19_01810 [soil metagenome]|jgi:hypothetical protein